MNGAGPLSIKHLNLISRFSHMAEGNRENPRGPAGFNPPTHMREKGVIEPHPPLGCTRPKFIARRKDAAPIPGNFGM